jgi:hypothetical protein
MKQRLIPFSILPGSWGLKGDAYRIAEAHYLYEDEELERKLAGITYQNDPKKLARENTEIDFRHGHIDAYLYDHRLATLDIDDPIALKLRQIEIETIHSNLTPFEAARQKVDIVTPPGVEHDIAMLEVNHQFNRMTRHEFEKQRASLRNEPWVAIINSGYDPSKGIDGVFFEFDWNPQWIDFLKTNGYAGHSPEQIIEDWFTDVCRSHSAAEFAGSIAPSRNLHLHQD